MSFQRAQFQKSPKKIVTSYYLKCMDYAWLTVNSLPKHDALQPWKR